MLCRRWVWLLVFLFLAVTAPVQGESVLWVHFIDVGYADAILLELPSATTMLVDAGCRYVIIGHSERRTHFGETDEQVHRKLQAALAHGLTAIVCIGETLAEREANRTFNVLRRQLDGGLQACSGQVCERLVLAYEPVWAIGTGRNATPEQAQEAHAFIRKWLSERCGAAAAQNVRIQYGGSVNAGNAVTLLQQPDVDGALVGGASLKADGFAAIVRAAADAKASTATRTERGRT